MANFVATLNSCGAIGVAGSVTHRHEITGLDPGDYDVSASLTLSPAQGLQASTIEADGGTGGTSVVVTGVGPVYGAGPNPATETVTVGAGGVLTLTMNFSVPYNPGTIYTLTAGPITVERVVDEVEVYAEDWTDYATDTDLLAAWPVVSVSNMCGSFATGTATSLLSFAQDILRDGGVLMVDGVVLGLTRGGWEFDPNITYDTWEYDGQLDPMAGTDVRRTARPVLKGTLIELGVSQLRAIEPLAAFLTTGTTSTTVTPTASATVITSGALLVNVVAVWPRFAGGFHRVTFPLALCAKYSVVGKDKSEVGVPIELHGRTATAGVAAYTHTVLWPSA